MQTATLTSLSTGQLATLAMLLEATAAKPGNVHRGADFEDVSYIDFAASAAAVTAAFDRVETHSTSVGEIVYHALLATKSVSRTNTNLGMLLLFAPLACVRVGESFETGVARVLASLEPADSSYIYAAIRLASPGGLGTAREHDVQGPAPANLLAAMQLGADHDLIARQYVSGFATVLSQATPWLIEGVRLGYGLQHAIIHAAVQLLAVEPDSLIARKCGREAAVAASRRAAKVLDAGTPQDEVYWTAIRDFDFWLRSDGHRRNPGTTADIIAAAIFVALRAGQISPQGW